jgi:hypothetical protein
MNQTHKLITLEEVSLYEDDYRIFIIREKPIFTNFLEVVKL